MEIIDRISGLDKLLELLTEHCRKHYGFKDNDDIEIDNDSVQFHLYHNAKRYFSIGVEKVISKEFGFIKYLVYNDKIDTGGKITEYLTYEYFKIPRKYFRGGKYARLREEMNDIFYHRILACLSIQDNPIDFLISILK